MRYLLNDTKCCTASKAAWEAKFQRQDCFLWRNSVKVTSSQQVTASLQPNKVCNRNKTLWLSFRDDFWTLWSSALNNEPRLPPPLLPSECTHAHTRRTHAHLLTFNPFGLIREGPAGGVGGELPIHILHPVFAIWREKVIRIVCRPAIQRKANPLNSRVHPTVDRLTCSVPPHTHTRTQSMFLMAELTWNIADLQVIN